MDLVFAGPLGAQLDQQALDQRAQQIADNLGVSLDNLVLTVRSAAFKDPGTRRQLYVSAGLDASSCQTGANVTLTTVTVAFSTGNETLEKLFIAALQAPVSNATIVTNADGVVFRSCSNSVTRSQRLVAVAPSPPSAPPPPFIATASINTYGTVLIGSAGIVTLLFGLCGQRLLGGTVRRRKEENEAQQNEAGESLLG